MDAPIIMHGSWGDQDDHPAHPIPSLTSLDIHAIKKTGGSDLIIVIASTLAADERSQTRLLDKIEAYLSFIQSSEYRESVGIPDPTTTRIVVRIHDASEPAVFDLLHRCEDWVASCHASLLVQPLSYDR